MFPEAFRKRIEHQKYIDADALFGAFREPSPVSIRLNRTKWNRIPLHSEPVPWCTSGYYLESRPSYTSDPLFHSGCYYPQEASSMFLEEVFRQIFAGTDPVRTLDLCAAPGGKSTHLSSLIGAKGLLIANEVIKPRSRILAENITKWGSLNTIVTNNDPADLGMLKGYFDLIVVDAPCSGEGMFGDPVAVREWSVENAIHCSERQKRILRDIWPALKQGGILIYCTCTFNPAENEQNMKWLTVTGRAESLRIDLSRFTGITEIFYEGVIGYGFYPGKTKGEGLFISALRKTEEAEVATIKNLTNPFKQLSRGDLSKINNRTLFPPENLYRSGDDIVYIGTNFNDYLLLNRVLRIVKPGTLICSVKNNNYIPYHELALSSGLRGEAFCTVEVDYKRAIAFLQHDNINVPEAPGGRSIVTYKGIRLGYINNLGNRINNCYPVEWRIRMRIPREGDANIVDWE